MRDPPRIFASPEARRRAVLVVVALLAAFVGLSMLVHRYLPLLSDPSALREGVASFGPLAPAAFVLLQATQIVVAPIPGGVTGVVSGYLFGALWGTVYSVIGGALGSYLAFALSRRYGRPFVERVVRTAVLDRFDALADERGLFALFLIFLVPGLPDDAICFAAGLSDLEIRKMVAVAVLGRLPSYAVTNLLGSELAAYRYAEAVVLLVILAVASFVGYWQRDRLLGRLSRR